jgi:hypothetical protein
MPKTKRREIVNEDRPIHPDWFYRLSDGPKFFGYGPTTIDDKIRSGEIPPLVSRSDSGRAKGWFGRVIIEWQAARQAKTARATEKA